MPREADERDRHVGARIRTRRVMVGLSQDRLGKAIGVTFQQVQKYEKGVNRIGASRLEQVARLLEVPVAYFFEGAQEPAPAADHDHRPPLGAPPVPFADPEARRVAAALARIRDPKVRRRLADLAESLARDEALAMAPKVPFEGTNVSVLQRLDD